MKKIALVICFIFCFLSVVHIVSAERQASRNIVDIAIYHNSNWRVVLDTNGTLECYGAGHGSWGRDKNIIIDYGTSRFWTSGSWSGPVIDYQKKDGLLHAVLLQYDSGQQRAGGRLYTSAAVQNVRLVARTYGAHIYITLVNGAQETYSIWCHPNLPGRLEQGIVMQAAR
jgi:hypothetical protein